MLPFPVPPCLVLAPNSKACNAGKKWMIKLVPFFIVATVLIALNNNISPERSSHSSHHRTTGVGKNGRNYFNENFQTVQPSVDGRLL